MTDESTYTKRLSREIDAAYQAYQAEEPGAEKRLLDAFVAQARNIALYRLGELYDGTVVHDAAHKAMVALKDGGFHGKSRLSTWFYRIATNESLTELGRLLKKREDEIFINVPVRDDKRDGTQIMDIPVPASNPTAALEVAELRHGVPPEQLEVFDLSEQGYTVDEIAHKTGLPRGTVAGRLRAAKQKMGVPPRKGRRAIKERARRSRSD